jgi:hypothetical protein
MFILGGDSDAIEASGRKGERRIRDLLWMCHGGPAPGERWLALYGVHVRQLTAPTREDSASGIGPLREIDFLVIDRTRGFVVIEAKGGELRLQGGVRWESRGGGNDWKPCDNPCLQARSAESNLLRRLGDKLGDQLFRPSWIWHAPAIALPFSDRISAAMPLEWHPDLIASSADCESPERFERWLESVFRYAGTHFKPNDPSRAADTVERALETCILPPFSAERSARKQVSRLLKQDRDPLDAPTPLHEFVRSKLKRRKVLVEGPAGTGKTFAAMIRVGLALREGPATRALYVCFNELLADQVSDMGSAHGQRFEATSFHRLCAHLVRRAGMAWNPPADNPEAEEFYRSRAPVLLSEALAKAPLLDDERPSMLVIDEAQDFHQDWIAALQMIAREDVTTWCLYDPAQLLFANLVAGAAGAVPGDLAAGLTARLAASFGEPDILSVNRRLSMHVFDFLRARKIIPHEHAQCDPTAPDGFIPEEHTAHRSAAAAVVHDIILDAIDEHGFSADQILVQAAVTPLNPEHPLRRTGANPSSDPWNVRGRYMLRPIGHADAEGNPNVIDMATAQKYKGCERPFVIVIRTPSMDDARLYTACTRARLGLAIVNVES